MTIHQQRKERIETLLDELSVLIDECGLGCDEQFVPFIARINEEMRVRLTRNDEKRSMTSVNRPTAKTQLEANICKAVDAVITAHFGWPWSPETQKLYARIVGLVEDLTEELAEKLFAAEVLLKSTALRTSVEQVRETEELKRLLLTEQKCHEQTRRQLEKLSAALLDAHQDRVRRESNI